MDLASHVARWKSHTPEQWVRTANQVFPPGLTFVLVVALAYQFAVLTWTVVPSAPATVVPVMPQGSRTAQARATDFTPLIGSNLFDKEAVAPVAVAVIDAPD